MVLASKEVPSWQPMHARSSLAIPRWRAMLSRLIHQPSTVTLRVASATGVPGSCAWHTLGQGGRVQRRGTAQYILRFNAGWNKSSSASCLRIELPGGELNASASCTSSPALLVTQSPPLFCGVAVTLA
jgi:hypothetical protein